MSAFDRFAPFIQEYIYRNRWDELHAVQTEAIAAILDTDSHVLITAGTASGKTEAAFFPILTRMLERPPHSFGALYIGPLKALINDQFERIRDVIDEAYIPVYAWHGDRSQSEKAKAMKHPEGILQMTPESLEALLMRHVGDARVMFCDLQFIVIDEIHAFMGADRGLQLQCLLVRLDRLISRPVRRIGLSATINDPRIAGQWLAAGTALPCEIINSQSGERQLQLAIWHDELPHDETDERIRAVIDARTQYLYRQVRGRKALVFTNSRLEAENTAVMLRELAEEYSERDIYRVHHGSISSALRDETESALRDGDEPAVAVATKTLELGIDLGHLERVVQLGAPNTCSSFVQRLGRTGRRGTPAIMRFITKNTPEGKDPFDDLPWELLLNIAIIQLYIEERWVEPSSTKACPYSLLFHQTLARLMQSECTGRELAKSILTLPPFKGVDPRDYLSLLSHMIDTDMLEKTEMGTLIPGLAGARLADHYRFYSVFFDTSGYRVVFRQRTLGEIDNLPEQDEIIVLAGHNWRVTETDEEKKCVYVMPSKGQAKNSWAGGAEEVHDRIVEKIGQILRTDTDYPYLLPNARDALANARGMMTAYRLDQPCTQITDRRLLLHPWLGSRKMNTLTFLLKNCFSDTLELQSLTQATRGMGVYIVTELPFEVFFARLNAALDDITPADVLPFVPTTPVDCYDVFLPSELLRKAFLYNGLDIAGLKAWNHTI